MELAGGDSLPNVPLPDLLLQDVPWPGVTLPDDPLAVARPDGPVGEEQTSPRFADVAMMIALRLVSGSCLVHFLCSNQLISGIYHYTRREVFELLKVYFIYQFCPGFNLTGFS